MIRKVTVLWMTGLITSICVISCCTDELSITGMESFVALEVMSDSTRGEIPLDTIRGPFVMQATAQAEILVAHAAPLVGNSMATTCEYDYRNRISYAILTSNLPFTYQGTTIEPWTHFGHLLDEDPIYYDQWRVVMTTIFDQEFLQDSEFETDWYNFNLIIGTNDNQTFEISDSLYFDL